jgi:hypothetical protein
VRRRTHESAAIQEFAEYEETILSLKIYNGILEREIVVLQTNNFHLGERLSQLSQLIERLEDLMR